MRQRTETEVDKLLSLQEAAAVLGISLAAARKRLQRGQLSGVRQAGRWYIRLGEGGGLGPKVDTGRDSGQDNGLGMGQQNGHESTLSNELVEQLRSENAVLRDDRARLWDELETRRREVSELHVLLQRALESRAPVYLPAPAPSSELGKTDTPPRRKFWWQFWKGPSSTAETGETISTAS